MQPQDGEGAKEVGLVSLGRLASIEGPIVLIVVLSRAMAFLAWLLGEVQLNHVNLAYSPWILQLRCARWGTTIDGLFLNGPISNVPKLSNAYCSERLVNFDQEPVSTGGRTRQGRSTWETLSACFSLLPVERHSTLCLLVWSQYVHIELGWTGALN